MSKRTSFLKVASLALIMAVGFTACKNDAKATEEKTEEVTQEVNLKGAAESAFYLMNMSKITITLADIAGEKTQSEEIKRWTSEIRNQFSDIAGKTQYIMKENQLRPVQAEFVKGDMEQMKRFTDILESSSPQDFDRNYVDVNTRVFLINLERLEKAILPELKNDQLREIGQHAMEVSKKQYERAEELRNTLR